MAKTVIEDHPPAYAYDDRTIKAVKSVLLEIGQILGSYRDKFVVVGGAVPWLLLDNPEMRHIGSLDVDLSLDPVALGDGEYAQLVDELRKHGYQRRHGGGLPFRVPTQRVSQHLQLPVRV